MNCSLSNATDLNDARVLHGDEGNVDEYVVGFPFVVELRTAFFVARPSGARETHRGQLYNVSSV